MGEPKTAEQWLSILTDIENEFIETVEYGDWPETWQTEGIIFIAEELAKRGL